jgi:hypothetical protein
MIRHYTMYSNHHTSNYHTRIATLRMGLGDLSFFEGRDFPSMRLLDVKVGTGGIPLHLQFGGDLCLYFGLSA